MAIGRAGTLRPGGGEAGGDGRLAAPGDFRFIGGGELERRHAMLHVMGLDRVERRDIVL